MTEVNARSKDVLHCWSLTVFCFSDRLHLKSGHSTFNWDDTALSKGAQPQ